MEVVSSSCPFSSVGKKEAREHIKKMVSCVIGHLSTEYCKLCTAKGRVSDSVKMKVLEQFDFDMLAARRKALGRKAPHQGGTVLPDGIVWVPNAAIKREKRLSERTYGEADTCFIRGSLSFDESVLYCVKHYKSSSLTATTSERDREVLASRVRHHGVVQAIGVSSKVYVSLGDWGMAQTVKMALFYQGQKWRKGDTDQFGHIAPELKATEPRAD
ncbi:hypothetical protein R1sor_014416 [Riccia sorocarpa]|uniref:Uncharacterized protein n=1 Tax=Riccia sorocarpa TaxID=122646 RepID=A0ABD3HCC7_9MARC